MLSLTTAFLRAFTLVSIFSPWEKCAINLIDKIHPSSVFFSCKTFEDCPSNRFYRSVSVPSQTILGLDTYELPTFKKTDLVFLVIQPDVFKWNNETIQKYRLRGKTDFKIVFVSNMSSDRHRNTENMRTLFTALWQSGLQLALVLLYNGSTVQIFTYFPFKSSESCEDVSPVLLEDCSSVQQASVYFLPKIVNLNKCPIYVSLVDDSPFIRPSMSGRLSLLLHEIRYRMNFSMQVVSPKVGERGSACGPGERTGLRGDVMSGKAHMAVAMFIRRECSALEYMGLAYWSCVGWCTPILSADDYVFVFLLKLLQLEVWVALISTGMSVVFVLFILGTLVAKQAKSARKLADVAFAVLGETPKHFLPSSLRSVMAFWLLECFVIRAAYESELKSRSTVPVGTHIIKDVDELAGSEMSLCGSATSLQMLESGEEPLVHKLFERTTICKGGLFNKLKSIAENKDAAMFTPDIRCSLSSSEINRKNSPLYSRTGGCFTGFEVSPIIMVRGSPFKKKVRQIQLRCFEAGLVQKWLDIRPPKLESGNVLPYSFGHLLPSLFVLSLGILAALFTFIVEILVHKWTWFKLKFKICPSEQLAKFEKSKRAHSVYVSRKPKPN